METIQIRGLTQNNLKNLSLDLPNNKIIVFTGVSGSGKSSIVFDTIAAEAARQLNETFPAFLRSRLPKHRKPAVERIDNLSPAVLVDQSALGSNLRSTVGTISELYATLRLLFSRIGQPYAGSASFFSFNDPNGMCPACAGLGKVTEINLDAIPDKSKTLADGAITDTTFKVGSWYWRQYRDSGLFDMGKPLCGYSDAEWKLLLYGVEGRLEGLYPLYKRRYLTRDVSQLGAHQADKSARLISQTLCPECHGKRLNRDALGCWINGCSIAVLCDMELPVLRHFLGRITDPRAKTMTDSLIAGLTRMIDIGLPYLTLSRETGSLSGGEAQRLKLVRYLDSGYQALYAKP